MKYAINDYLLKVYDLYFVMVGRLSQLCGRSPHYDCEFRYFVDIACMLWGKYKSRSIEVGAAVLHLLFWITIYHLFSYFLGYGGQDPQFASRFSWFLMPITMASSYFFSWFLIPNYLIKRRFWLFSLYALYTIIITIQGVFLSLFYGLVYLMGPVSDVSAPLTRSLPSMIVGVLFVVFVFVFIALVVKYHRAQVEHDELSRRYLSAQLDLKQQELQYLKMQIHPHFLFNTLNTIYGYALAKKAEAPEMILRLSSLLDYILYQVAKPRVYLRDEVAHIKDYIELERLRFHDTLEVEFDENLISVDQQIAPMLLIPFIENAFKHAAPVDGFFRVFIGVESDDTELKLRVQNSYDRSQPEGIGIGTDNIAKRLDMLYPDRHTLAIDESSDYYKVELTINHTHEVSHL